MPKYKIVIYLLIFMITFFNKAISDDTKVLFDFKINKINGEELNFSKFKGKTFLLVNVASKCGFTNQYTDLQNLYELYKDRGLIVLGIPSNQFGSQEPGSESEIKNFCETNFNITFPMTGKYDVKGENSHPIYLWAKETYGKSTIPKWNFHKILINKQGNVEDTFASFTNPMSNKIIKKIDKIL
jgi:glutathione peroxidase